MSKGAKCPSLCRFLLSLVVPIEAEKIDASVAKAEFAKSVRGAKTNIANVEAMQEQLREIQLAELRAQRASMQLDEEMKSWRTFALWDLWHEQQARVKLRQNLFVITGPSKMGKSQFLVHSLAGDTPDNVLMVNCMNVLDPDLRDFALGRHSAIIFDEGGPEMVQRHRDLFQAPRHNIKLAHSATGCYCYSVNLWRVKLVVTCNGWFEQLEKLSCADREWVEANTCVLEVTTPMWEE